MDNGKTIKGRDIKKPFCVEMENKDTIFFDLAEKKETPAVNSRHGSPFEAMFQNSSDLIFLSRRDQTGMIRYSKINPAARKLFGDLGLQKEEYSLSDLYQGDELTVALSNYELCEKTGRTVTFLKELLVKNRPVWFHVSLNAYTEEGENRHCCIAQSRTELYAAKDENIALKAQYESILHNIDDPVYCVDVYSDGRMLLSFINPAAERVSGFVASRVVGMPLEELLEDNPCYLEGARRHLKKATAGRAPILFMEESTFGGNRYYGATTMKSIQLPGRKRVIVYSKDMTHLVAINNRYRDEDENYNAILKNSKNILVVFGVRPDNRFVFENISDSFSDTIGKSLEEIRGKTPGDYFPDHIAQKIEYYLRQGKESEKPCSFELDFWAKGKQVHHEVFYTPVIRDGSVVKIIAVGVDRTYQKTLIDRLDTSMQEYETLFCQNNFGVWVMSIRDDGVYMERCNKKFCALFGYTRENIIGRKLEEYYNRDNIEGVQLIYRLVSEKKKSIRRSYAARLHNRSLHVDMTVTPIIKEGRVDRVIGVAQDYTDLIEGIERNKYLSEHDVSTGLYNRRYLNQFIRKLQKEYHKDLCDIFIASFDLNGLKFINDHYGHSVGDELILRASGVISRVFKEYMAARLGGDEFCVVGCSEDRGEILQKVRAFDTPFLQEDFAFPISIAAGLCFYEDDMGDLEIAMRKSEQDMYRSKFRMKAEEAENRK